ncbi:hypothetical protein CODIS_36840 [Candidatus Thiodiazotropha endolucinida]|uniref:Uncharacterized protein n=1 Tax=Candidatus Thiodiazotropha endolucinida TaxID=1655433 RepID=A0A7Z1AEH0_9GAMM|nr:hypothetical protein CODIS_36840 [Candidatus Thiodiazotropha endolucinida]
MPTADGTTAVAAQAADRSPVDGQGIRVIDTAAEGQLGRGDVITGLDRIDCDRGEDRTGGGVGILGQGVIGGCGSQGRGIVDRGDCHRRAAHGLQCAAGSLGTGITVVEGPIDLHAGRRHVVAVRVGDLAQDVVDIGRGGCLTVGVGEGDDQFACRGRGVERCNDLTALDQIAAR